MSGKPVVFLAFANDQDTHLEMLKKEARDIYRELQPRHDAGHLEIYREESADIGDIFHNFNRFKDRVQIFHYGGHASGTHLQLEGQAGNATGLAQLLGAQKQLQLVVLNGCSTRNQVSKLLKAGVKAVIATSVPVNDGMATDFATQLYQALAAGDTLGLAFQTAKAFLETKYENAVEASIFRGFASMTESEEEFAVPWGLYLQPEDERVLNWKLPVNLNIQLPAGLKEKSNKPYKPNDEIVTVLEAMAEHNKKLYGEMEDEFGDPRDKREYPEVIIKNFPWPIGSQLRILVANSEMMNKAGMKRLRQLIYTYVVSSQFVSYILLAQLWDAKNEGKLSLDADFKQAFSLLPQTADAFDFVTLMLKVDEMFKAANLNHFIEEFEDLLTQLREDGELSGAYRFLESVRKQMNNDQIDYEEIESICQQCELCLTTFLKGIAFMAKYRLITIKEINIIKPKHKEALFRMNMGVLNAFDKEFLRSREKDQPVYTDSHSVLVVKNLRDIQQYLNLSPFVIDKNAFTGKPIPNICLYFRKEGGKHEYLSVNYNINKETPDASDLFMTEAEPDEVLNEQMQLFTTS
jgi:hypothetical protein